MQDDEESDPGMSIADVCRETYRLSDNAIEMLLEEDKKESIRSALRMLESKVDQLPSGYGNHLERLSADFEKWTTDLKSAVEVKSVSRIIQVFMLAAHVCQGGASTPTNDENISAHSGQESRP